MNLTATASSIAASGGIRPDSHITARPVTATKAGPVALTLAGAGWDLAATNAHARGAGVALRLHSATLTGQRSRTDERERVSKRFGLMLRSRRATSRSGGLMVPCQRKAKISAHHVHNLGNPCAEKVRPHRARQLFL